MGRLAVARARERDISDPNILYFVTTCTTLIVHNNILLEVQQPYMELQRFSFPANITRCATWPRPAPFVATITELANDRRLPCD